MLLTLTLTAAPDGEPATLLGFLLHKHPEKLQTFELPFGQVHIFYTEATTERCTAALLLDVDPVALSRTKLGAPENRPLWPYVNDRPYVASSFMSVALSRVLGTALGGRCEKRPEAAGATHDLTVTVAAIAAGRNPGFIAAAFEPLGYSVTVDADPMGIATFTLRGQVRLSDLLSHLYVLVPAIDREKHYWVDEREVEKLLRHGEGWLETHPLREVIARRYLKFQRGLVRDAVAALGGSPEAADSPGTDAPEGDESLASVGRQPGGVSIEAAPRLDEARRLAVIAALKSAGAKKVVDLGCGEGKLLRALLADPTFTDIVGVDVSMTVLRWASDKLKLDRMPERQRERIKLLQGSAVYRDDRLRGADAIACVEVIEHIDLERLDAFRDAIFGHLRPQTVLISTPNAEYNVHYDRPGLRHTDHRFEWTRAEFEDWSSATAAAARYRVTFQPIGAATPPHASVGAPTQMAVFTRES